MTTLMNENDGQAGELATLRESVRDHYAAAARVVLTQAGAAPLVWERGRVASAIPSGRPGRAWLRPDGN